jgi:hypothetical protein
MNKQVSPWVIVDGYAAARHIVGADPNDIRFRVALIEKSPRVRIREHSMGTQRLVDWFSGTQGREERLWPEHLDWCYGDKGDDAFDEESRAWCDAMLKLLGYTLEN